MKKIKVNVLSNIPGYSKGETVMVAVDSHGTPTQRFWRRRLSDAKTDNCIEVVADLKSASEAVAEEKTTAKPKTTGSKKQEKSK